MTLRRGFKSECERIAGHIRCAVGLPEDARLTADAIARYLGVELVAGDELLPRSRFDTLRSIQSDAFSACTFAPRVGKSVVVFNPVSSLGRRNSDIAHELAHILLNHELSRIETIGEATFLSCDPTQEEEASWLAGCLLLPRELLLREVRRGKSSREIAEDYQVSDQMASYRIRVTGVLKQLNPKSRQRTN